jgi:sugar phosphate permease
MMGLVSATVSVGLLTRVPVDGHYFWDLFPAFVLGGTGLGFSFVPVTIAALTGVERADAGVASGLVNTSRQIGGAIGLAGISTITASVAASYANAHGVPVASSAATVSGFQTAFVVLGGALVGAFVVAAVFLRPARERAAEVEAVELQEAA